MKIELALISVSKKEGVVDLARRLREMGIQIISTGGTGSTLKEAGISYTPVSEHTGFPEILDGRVKTLHPRVHAGILAQHDHLPHQTILEKHDIPPIGLVVVNLYPFTSTVSRPDVTLEEAVENIDIGGPSLIRAAAKNYRHTTVVVDPSDYLEVISEMRVNSGEISDETRWQLARKAFHHTAAYDAGISAYFEKLGAEQEEGLPPVLTLNLARQASLRYGENPHQRAALYRPVVLPAAGVVSAEQLQGKQLSFNNYIDLNAAWDLVQEFDGTACGIIKHTNPCGAALGDKTLDAYQRALACDPVSAFGSIVAFNRPVDRITAEAMADLFVEVVIAPGYEEGAARKFAEKKNLRVMELAPCRDLGNRPPELDIWQFDLKSLSGGILAQDKDLFFVHKEDLKVVTDREPTDEELADLLFAWTVCKHVKSNAIVFAQGERTIGVGAGQMSRVDSVRIAAQKAQLPLAGGVMASDAFLPFRDGLEEAAKVGIRAVIQPGGSVRDEEVIEAADEHGMTMVFTGVRHFKH